jgi:hypothetical protein
VWYRSARNGVVPRPGDDQAHEANMKDANPSDLGGLRGTQIELEKKVEILTGEPGRAREQQTATSEILRVISSSPTDLNGVQRHRAQRGSGCCGASCFEWSFPSQEEKLSRFYQPDLSTNLDSPFARDADDKLIRRSYWLDMDDRSLVMLMTKGIGANLTNDEKRAHLSDIRREHLIDKVCTQEILPPEK